MVFRPVGSLSPAVYWRRRVFVAAVLIVALLLLWTLLAGGGGDTGSDRHPAAAGTHRAGASPTRTPATITPSPGAAGPPAPPADGQASTVPAGDSADSGTRGAGSDSGAPPTCPDSALRLAVDTDRSAYQVGDHPVIRLTLTNTSAAICTRDVGAAEQEALVYAGPDPGPNPFWSSNDCNPGGDPDVRAMDTGEPVHFSVTWPGVSSRPECAGTPAPADPGDYSVVVRVGSLRSDPAPITLD